jgi:hypothetical protein
VREERGAECKPRRQSLGKISGYLREIQAWGSQRQTPNSNPPDTPTFINKNFFNTNFVFYSLKLINGEGKMVQEVAKNTESGNCRRDG